MGWLDKLKRKLKKNTVYADMLNGLTPVFSQFGQDIYASDVVQQAISCIVMECKKLIPQHVKTLGCDVTPVSGNIQSILNMPNEIMTTTDFIEKIVWQLYFNYNAFVIPTYYTLENTNGSIQKVYTGLYPIAPTNVDFLQDESGKLYVKFIFANDYETTLAYSDVIHIRKNYSVNEFMGGNECGQPDNDALLKTLQLNDQLLTNLSKAMVSSCAVNGVVKFKSMLDGGKTEKALAELEQKLKNSESGFLPLDISADFEPIQREIQMVDADTLQFLDEKILRHFGVPLCILTGDYTLEQYNAFFQKTIEPICRLLSQAFTRALFTPRERSFGNEIKFYTKDLIFMSTDQTLEMVNLLGASGSLYENEKRVAFGLRPLPELEGVRMMSLNYVNVEYAKEYQLQRKDGTDEGT